jgi:hypothetical protein
MTHRSETVRDIVGHWFDKAVEAGDFTNWENFWYLYDLACGRALPPAPARAFVAKMDASKPKVKIVLDWLCKVE